jgi:hypothetical protein
VGPPNRGARFAGVPRAVQAGWPARHRLAVAVAVGVSLRAVAAGAAVAPRLPQHRAAAEERRERCSR